jgi:hypothetical protein
VLLTQRKPAEREHEASRNGDAEDKPPLRSQLTIALLLRGGDDGNRPRPCVVTGDWCEAGDRGAGGESERRGFFVGESYPRRTAVRRSPSSPARAKRIAKRSGFSTRRSPVKIAERGTFPSVPASRLATGSASPAASATCAPAKSASAAEASRLASQ